MAAVFGDIQGTGSLNLLTTLARHRPLYRGWLSFAGALILRGVLPRADGELVILRVAHNCANDYEWRHHERLARAAGLSAEEIARVRAGALAPGWTARQAALLQATDELHEHREIRDFVWPRLRGCLDDRELIELCMLVGHYEMLAMTIASLRIQPEPPRAGRPPIAARVLRRVLTRRARRGERPPAAARLPLAGGAAGDSAAGGWQPVLDQAPGQPGGADRAAAFERSG